MLPVNHGECIDVYMKQHFDKFRAYFLVESVVQKRDDPIECRPLQRPRQVKAWDVIPLTLNAVSNKEKLFWAILQCPHLFKGMESAKEKLQKKMAVVVVGNGPITDALGAEIDDDKAAVVRCNDYRTSTNELSHGRRCDVQVINCHSSVPISSDEILGWIAPHATVVVAERLAARRKVKSLLQKCQDAGHDIAELSEEARVVAFDKDATRGFLAVALAVHAMIPVGGTVDVYGFGGSGHHNNVQQNIGHGVLQEWALWGKLSNLVPWFKLHSEGMENAVFANAALVFWGSMVSAPSGKCFAREV
jgi:hypothetical protein